MRPQGDPLRVRVMREEAGMSRRNGDRARFQKERKRRMLRRQRIQELIKSIRPQPPVLVEPAGVKAE